MPPSFTWSHNQAAEDEEELDLQVPKPRDFSV